MIPIVAGVVALATLGGITAFVLGWQRQPTPEGLAEQERLANPDEWRPACWVDDPNYNLGYVSDAWLANNRRRT
jgi:hypothetical protein